MLDPSQATTLHHWKKVSVKRLIKTKAFGLILLHGSMWDHPDTTDEFGKLMVTLQVSYKTCTCMSYPRMSRTARLLENTDGAHLYVRAILKVAANCASACRVAMRRPICGRCAENSPQGHASEVRSTVQSPALQQGQARLQRLCSTTCTPLSKNWQQTVSYTCAESARDQTVTLLAGQS